MALRGEGSGGKGEGKWGKRGREVGVRGEGSGECLPPVHPLTDSYDSELYGADVSGRCLMAFNIVLTE